MKLLWKINVKLPPSQELTWHFYYNTGTYTPAFLAQVCKDIVIKNNLKKGRDPINNVLPTKMLNSIVHTDDDLSCNPGSAFSGNTNVGGTWRIECIDILK
jgi:hypothetical protein